MVILTSIMIETWRKPYNQLSSLWDADIPVEVPENRGKLRMPGYQALFFESIYEILHRAEFQPGTPVIDLSGRLPGVTYAMGGYLPNAAWVPPNYTGSHQAFAFALSRLTCLELASAWVIKYATPWPYHYDPNILLTAGLEYQKHYQQVGVARLPVDVQYPYFVYTDLLFLKPKADWPERVKSCVASRATGG
jgi:hypothetical protein